MFRALGFGFRVPGFGFRVSGFGFRVSGFWFRISGFGLQVSGFGLRAAGFGFRDSGFGLRANVPGCTSWFRVGGLHLGFTVRVRRQVERGWMHSTPRFPTGELVSVALRRRRARFVQGYLAHKKHPPP